MNPEDFFLHPNSIAQKQYEALRMFYIEKVPAKDVAKEFGYSYRGFTTIASNFRKGLKKGLNSNSFFTDRKKGKKRDRKTIEAKAVIVKLRKKYYSVEDIKTTLDSKGYGISEKTIYNILSEEGFSKLPRRLKSTRKHLETPVIEAEKSICLDFLNERFKSSSAGILCLLPYIEKYGINELIQDSNFPGTSQLGKLNSILSFVALKASNARRILPTIFGVWIGAQACLPV